MQEDSPGRRGRARITAEEYNHSLGKLVSTKRKVKPSRKAAFMAAFPVKASPRLHPDDKGAAVLPPNEATVTHPEHNKTPTTGETNCKAEFKSPVDVKQKLQVFVRGLLLPKTLCLQLDPETSVSDLKALVESESGIKPQDQHLYIGRNFQLCDLLSIRDHGIQQDQNIELHADGLVGGGLEKEQSRNTFFLNLSRGLGPHWEKLTITLGFSVSELDTFKANSPGDVELQSFRMLDAWWNKQDNPENAPERLREALKAIRRVDLALQVLDAGQKKQHSPADAPEKLSDALKDDDRADLVSQVQGNAGTIFDVQQCATELAAHYHETMKVTTHPKFCLYVCSLCLVMAAVGHYFSGVFISYLIVTGLLLWPALEYHNVTGSLYQRIGPILQQLDHSIDSPRREKKRAQKRARNRSNPAADTDSSSDSDLDEFCPTPGPAVDAALAHAAGRSARSSSGTSASVFGGLSKGLSLEFTDDEFTDTEPPSYMGGLSQVPSFDNTAYDHSADELEIDLPYDDHPPVPGNPEKIKQQGEREKQRSPERMPFDPSHFRDSTDVDEALAEDLEFPDVEADGKLGRRNSRGKQTRDEPLLPPGAAMILSHAVTSLMSDAMLKLQDMGSQDDNSSTSEPSQVLRQRQLPKSETSMGRNPSPPKLLTMDSDSTDFEMLDRAELEQEGGQVAGEKKNEATPRRSGYGIGLLTSWLSEKK